MRIIFNVKLLAILLGILPFMFTSCASTDVTEANCKRVSVEEFADAVKKGDLQILDLRTPEEMSLGSIEGATMLNFRDEKFSSGLAKLDREDHYAIYCKGGGRSGKALKQMQELGFTNVIELEGGFDAYRKHTSSDL